MPKISILMPACNVEKYIRECMDSVLAQTLKDIEIICIDDGSKDRTGEILDDYSTKDNRLKVVHKVNTGYGHSMNVALGMATGEYIGIVETDDFIEPEMFESMYSAAIKNDADVVKTNYFDYYSTKPDKCILVHNLNRADQYNTVFSPKDDQKIFMVSPSIWSGIYRTKMIRDNNICFTETPGASYQDTSFAFKIWACAQKVYLIEDGYLHYRRDNESSSVNSPRKVFCVCDEYEEIDRFIEENNKKEFVNIKNAIQFSSYFWNYNRLGVEYRYAFLLKIEETFRPLYDQGNLNKDSFREDRWNELMKILEDPQAYFLESSRRKMAGKDSVAALVKENKALKKQIKKMKGSTSYRIGRAITALPRKVKTVGKK